MLDYKTDGDHRMLAFEFKIALEDFNKAISLSPADANLYWRRGLCKENLLYYNDALADFSKAISLQPKDAYYNAKANLEFILKQYPAAIKDFDQALKDGEASTDNAISFYQRGMAKYYTKDKDGACADFEKSYEGDNTYNQTLDALTNYCNGIPEDNTPESNALESSSEDPAIKTAIANFTTKAKAKLALADMKGAEENFTNAKTRWFYKFWITAYCH